MKALTWKACAVEIAAGGLSDREATLITYFRSCSREVQSLVMAGLADASPLVGGFKVEAAPVAPEGAA